MDTGTQKVRASLARKSLSDARQRAAAASLLKLTETDVLALQHLAWAGALTPGQLAVQLRLTSGGTTALLRRLERLAYVCRDPHPEDRRSTLIRLSPHGEERAAELYAPLVHALDEATLALADDERAVVATFLARVADIGEARAGELARTADLERPQIPRVPVPGLWA